MQDIKQDYEQLISNLGPILVRRRRLIVASVLVASAVAFAIYGIIGERYQPYTLLRVGQGIKDRSIGSVGSPLGDGIDLVSRIDSLGRIVTTDHVIRLAAAAVGPERLFNEKDAPFFARLRFKAGGVMASSDDPEAKALDSEMLSTLRDLISTKPEGKSDLLRISFRYPDPVIAADFLNALANGLVATQADLIQVPGADVFFQEQAKRLEREAEHASAALENFSVGASIYSVADQRSLLLKRANELTSQVASTRGLIEERRGQRQTIIDQLMVLRPVAQSRTVTGIVSTLAGRDKASRNVVGNEHSFDEAPPLLLVRVYQDAMASLLKINSDLNGSLQLEKAIAAEIEQVNAELASLSSKEAEYDRLKRVLTRASAAADHYGTRVIEEQINGDIAKKTQLSSVRVVQMAEEMTTPIFPRPMQLGILALVGGLLVGAALAIMMELTRTRRQDGQQGEQRDELDTALAELGRRSVRRF